MHEDEVLQIVIAEDAAAFRSLNESYARNVTENNASTYTPVNGENPGVYQVYKYSSVFSVLFLEERLK